MDEGRYTCEAVIHIFHLNVEKYVGNETVENCKQEKKTVKILLQRSLLLFSLLNCNCAHGNIKLHGAFQETKYSTLVPSKILSASVSMKHKQTKSGPIEVKQIDIQFDTSKSKEKN